MKIIHFSDIHSTINGLVQLAETIKIADLVILSGDITHFGHKQEANTIISKFEKLNNKIVAITGNCDNAGVLDYLIQKGISIEGNVFTENNYDFVGVGGSLITPFHTPNEFSEDYYQAQFKKLADKINSRPFILVSHQPPYKTELDKIMVFKHVGSKSLREFIENHQPVLCLCGHVHEAIGIEEIGKTKVVNPGSFRAGKYAEIDIDGEKVEVELKSI